MGKPKSEVMKAENLTVLLRQVERSINGCKAALTEADVKGMRTLWIKKAGLVDYAVRGLANLDSLRGPKVSATSSAYGTR